MRLQLVECHLGKFSPCWVTSLPGAQCWRCGRDGTVWALCWGSTNLSSLISVSRTQTWRTFLPYIPSWVPCFEPVCLRSSSLASQFFRLVLSFFFFNVVVACWPPWGLSWLCVSRISCWSFGGNIVFVYWKKGFIGDWFSFIPFCLGIYFIFSANSNTWAVSAGQWWRCRSEASLCGILVITNAAKAA